MFQAPNSSRSLKNHSLKSHSLKNKATPIAVAAVVSCFAFSAHLGLASAATTAAAIPDKPAQCSGNAALEIKSVTVNGKAVNIATTGAATPSEIHLNGLVTKDNPGSGVVKTGDTVSVTFRAKEACKQYFTGSGQTSPYFWGAPSDNDSIHFYAFETNRYFLSKADGTPVVTPFVDVAAPQKLVEHKSVKFDSTADATIAIKVPSCNFQIDLVAGYYGEGSWTALDANGGMEGGMEKVCPTAAPTTTTSTSTTLPATTSTSTSTTSTTKLTEVVPKATTTTSTSTTVAPTSTTSTSTTVKPAAIVTTTTMAMVETTATKVELAHTGLDTNNYAALGFALLGMGGAFVLASRRIRQTA